MQTSDDLMWRYYELLTDLSMPDVMALRAKNEPMAAKMALARHIVADFHSAESAEQAQADFDREVRHGDVPADIQAMDLPSDARASEGIRMPKLLVAAGLAESRSDAERKLKAGAVEINGERVTDLLYSNGAGPLTVRVGTKWKRINL
jgi:tyrosyl-tRNA synthetase